METDKQTDTRDSSLRLMSWWKPDDVAKAKVLVAGAGALGNEVVKNLALMGVGHILIVDFDVVEYGNLARSVLFRESDADQERPKAVVAAERAMEINPHIQVETLHGDIGYDIGLGIFRRVDVVIGCLDNRVARRHLNRFSHRFNKVWVDGAIHNLEGHVMVYKPGHSCYECNLQDLEREQIRERLGCSDIAQRNATGGRVPTTPISSSIVAAIQVQEALKVIHGYDDKLLSKHRFYYEGMTGEVFMANTSTTPEPKDHCDSHRNYDELIESPLSAQTTVADTLDWLAEHLGEPNPIINMHQRLITEITTHQSNKIHQVLIPFSRFSNEEAMKYEEIPHEAMIFSKYIDKLDKNFFRPEMTLYEVGIPPLHILQVSANEDTYFVELSKDPFSLDKKL